MSVLVAHLVCALLVPLVGLRWYLLLFALDRFLHLSQLPEGAPTRTTARGAIDRFSTWPTVRLTTPEVAI